MEGSADASSAADAHLYPPTPSADPTQILPILDFSPECRHLAKWFERTGPEKNNSLFASNKFVTGLSCRVLLLHRYVKRFRGGLVFKAHRWLYHSTLGSRVIKKKKKFCSATPHSQQFSQVNKHGGAPQSAGLKVSPRFNRPSLLYYSQA